MLHRIAIAVAWVATAGMASGAPAAPAASWSLLPQPVDARPAGSGVVTIADGAPVAARGADRKRLQAIADRFMQLVSGTRGLRLRTMTAADAQHPLITFDLDPHASVVGDSGCPSSEITINKSHQ